jgi:hypothetical protein
MEVGELTMDSADLPVVADVFGGAQGVLGTEGLGDKRILIDFGHDRVSIMRSKGQLNRTGFETLPLRRLRDSLLALDVRVGGILAAYGRRPSSTRARRSASVTTRCVRHWRAAA